MVHSLIPGPYWPYHYVWLPYSQLKLAWQRKTVLERQVSAVTRRSFYARISTHRHTCSHFSTNSVHSVDCGANDSLASAFCPGNARAYSCVHVLHDMRMPNTKKSPEADDDTVLALWLGIGTLISAPMLCLMLRSSVVAMLRCCWRHALVGRQSYRCPHVTTCASASKHASRLPTTSQLHKIAASQP